LNARLPAGKGAHPKGEAEKTMATATDQPWWESRALVIALVLASAIPLLYPPIPPLVDLLGHMGRYRVELDLQHSSWLQLYYSYHWAAIGNLGVDLLVMAFSPLMGLEPAVKFIVILIPPLTVGGFLWVAREVHGRIPPTAYFALPFAYGHPFLFGFVNFALSMALAMLAFGLWLHLARIGRTRLRAWLFVPISLIIFFCHTYGWGALGLLCFSAEAVRQHDRGVGWLKAGWSAALQASVMALPIIIMLAWRSETHGGSTGDWFNWKAKFYWLQMTLRDRWKWFDIASAGVAFLVLIEALRNPRLTFSRNLAFSGLVLVAGYILLPRIIFGSAYADMRLAPYMFAVLLLAIRFRGETNYRLGNALAIAGLLFCVVRLGTTTFNLVEASDDQQAKLTALDHVPEGARVVSFVQLPCTDTWRLPRNSHLGAMVMVRRRGFSNDQWVVEGSNLLDLKYHEPGYFASDPSQIVRPNICRDGLHRTIDESLRTLPRNAFDFVWLIDPPHYDPRLVEGMEPVWRGPHSILYRIKP
jgi:hypothetical protein